METIGQSIILSISSATAGFVVGFMVRGFMDKRHEITDYSKIVLLVVTLMWSLSLCVDIVSPAYETSPMVHGLMGAIVGFFYRPGGFKKGGQDGESSG